MGEEANAQGEDYEDKWSEKYLTIAAQVGAMQKDDKGDGVSATQALDMLDGGGNANAMQMGCMPMGMNPMMMMGMMNPMMGMMNPMMGMMNPMRGMMNPMMGMMGMMRPP